MKATPVEILREAVRVVVPLLAGKGVKVTQIGMQAFVRYDPRTKQPKTVNIPYVPDNASDDLITAVQGFVDHEVAHILFTDARVLESMSASGVAALGNVLEDTFIERRMKATYKGSVKNLTNTWAFVQEKIVDPAIAQAVATGDAQTVLSAAIVTLCRFWAGQKELKDAAEKVLPICKPYVDAIGQDLIDQIPLIASTSDTYKLAVAMHNRLEELRRRQEEEEKRKRASDEPGDGEPCEDGDGGDSGERGETGISAESEGSDSGDAGESPDDADEEGEEEADSEESEEGESEQDEEGEGEEGDDAEEPEGEKAEPRSKPSASSEAEPEAGDDAPEAGESESSDEEAGEEEKARKDAEALIGALENAFKAMKSMDDMMGGIISDEIAAAVKAADYLPFTKDFDRIEVFTPVGDMSSMLEILNSRVASSVAPVQRHLERCIAAKSHSRHVTGYRSGRLNASSLHRIAVGDDRLFRRKVTSRTKDAAVSLVVDMSGSMSGYAIELAIQAAYAMSLSLDRLNINHEVIGFTTTELPYHAADGTSVREELDKAVSGEARRPSRVEPIYMPILKPFGQRLTTDRKAAFAGSYQVNLRNNTDGESIEYAAKRLAAQKESRKIMIVLSDGEPFGGWGNLEEQSKHLRSTVERLEQAGINTFGIGILSDAVTRYYPRNVVLNNMSDLPGAVMRNLEQMILGAEHA